MKLTVLYSLILIYGCLFTYGATTVLGIPFCDLSKSSRYQGKIVTTRGVLYRPGDQNRVDGGEAFLFSPACNNRDNFILVNIEKVSNKTLPKDLTATITDAKPRLFDVEVKGRLSISLMPSFGHLDWFRTKLDVTDINFENEVSNTEALPNLESRSPIIEASTSLQALNTELLLWLFGGSESVFRDIDIFNNIAKVTLNNRALTESDFVMKLRDDEATKFVVRTKNLSRMNDTWRIRGTVDLLSKNQKLRRIRYSNSFVQDKTQTWKLVGLALNDD